jgi:hypothetical protein
METIHIFDEFKTPPSEITPEEKHRKRIQLEPLIFDILKAKYGKILQEHYKSYQPYPNPPPGSENGLIVIIERRIHENLQFILHNAAWATATGWRVAIVCSDVNAVYCETIAEGKALIIPFFKGNPERSRARDEYNETLKTPEFYEALPSENLLFMEMDSYLRKPIPDFFTEYDYIGSPFSWDMNAAGGDLTFRKKSIMIDICKNFKPQENFTQDLFVTKGIRELNYQIPNAMDGLTYFLESIMYIDPIGVHQWWTFFWPGLEDAEFLFKELLTLECGSKKSKIDY